MTDQYPVPGQPEGTWQASDGAPVASPDAAPSAADHAPAGAPDQAAQPVAGHAPDAWPTPSGWQAPQDNPYGAPAGPSAYAAGYPTGQAAGYPAAPAARCRVAVPDLGLPRLRLPRHPRPGRRRRQLAVRHHGVRRGRRPAGRASDGPVEVGIQWSQVTHWPDPGHRRSRGPALGWDRRVRRHAGGLVQHRHEHGGAAPVGRRQVRAPLRDRRGDRRVRQPRRGLPGGQRRAGLGHRLGLRDPRQRLTS